MIISSADLSNFVFLIFYICDLFATKLGLILHHHELECLAKNCVAVYKVKVTKRFEMSMNVFLDDIS